LWFHLNRRFHRLLYRLRQQPFLRRPLQRRRAQEQEMEPVLEQVLE
jgi:DNA-binding GntR family transcriptional regulator